MKHGEHLYFLVQSLNRTEKRYIKLHLEKHQKIGGSLQLRLFSFLLDQRTYQEEELKKAFKGTAIDQQLSSIKVQLYYQVLRLLRQYGEKNREAQQEVMDLIQYSSLLLHKNLLGQASKLVERAIKKAKKYDLGRLELEAYELYRLIMYNKLSRPALVEFIEQIHPRERQLLKHQEDQQAMAHNKDQLLLEHITQLTMTPEEVEPYLPKETSLHPGSVRSELMYYDLKALAGRVTMDFQMHKKYRQQQQTLMLDSGFAQDSPLKYVVLLNNLMLQAAQENIDEAFELTVQLEDFLDHLPSGKRSDLCKIRAYAYIYSNRLVYYTRKEMVEEGIRVFEDDALPFLEANKAQLPADRTLVYALYAIHLYFRVDNFKQAHHFLQHIMHESTRDLRIDLKANAHLANLVVHYERKGLQHLDLLLNSTKRYLKQHKWYHSTEKMLVRFFDQALKKETQNHISLQRFEHLLQQIEAVETSGQDRLHTLEYFMYKDWARSKVEGKSFREICLDNLTKAQ